MVTVTISIPDAEFERLRRLAEQEGASVQSLAAAGVQQVINDRVKKPHSLTDEDILMIEEGLDDLGAERVVSHADIVREVERNLED